MPTKHALDLHFSHPRNVGGKTIFSSYIAALRDARRATGRDQNTGQLADYNLANNWLGAVCYLILLDQIGKCFAWKDREDRFKFDNPIDSALIQFSEISEENRNALVALRNAFAHDYSLYNNNKKYPQFRHAFIVCCSKEKDLIKPATLGWDGDIATLSDEHKTEVNLFKLAELVEAIASRLVELKNKDELKIKLTGGSDTLLRKYSILSK